MSKTKNNRKKPWTKEQQRRRDAAITDMYNEEAYCIQRFVEYSRSVAEKQKKRNKK